ncbi:MAG: NUDIX hydrolase [SAR86 cluster bacterium]|jgi:8-oxo-dGTP pyrophosphatase MutT (NUDIX family)|nr:NUDIX hydrolase [SAR86 cluster bacterium]
MKDPLKGVKHELADPNEKASEPKPAATVILARDASDEGIEVFLMERASSTNFGGAYVFPGGKVDFDDSVDGVDEIIHGLTDQEASKILGLESGGLSYWVACIRECFEEAGILLAYDTNHNNLNFKDQDLKERFINYRDRLNKRESVLKEMCKKEQITLSADRLAYVSHWVTPKIEKKRYTTRFFIAQAPQNQEAVHDGKESINSLWIKPEDALKRWKERKILLIMPTIKSLEMICGFNSTQELLENKQNLDPGYITTIEPKFFMENGKLVGLLPGEPGYEDH